MQVTIKQNYIQLINHFWQINMTEGFSSLEISLYFYLLHVNNSCYWKRNFSHNNKKIEAVLQISFKTLQKGRDTLKRKGLIDFKTTNGSPNVDYSILTLSKFPKVSDKVKGSVRDQGGDEINKEKEKLNNNSVVGDFSMYKNEFIKSENSDLVNAYYEDFKLKKGALAKLVDAFINSRKMTNIEPHKNFDGFLKHFHNWMNVQAKNNKLTDHIKFSIKSPDSL